MEQGKQQVLGALSAGDELLILIKMVEGLF